MSRDGASWQEANRALLEDELQRLGRRLEEASAVGSGTAEGATVRPRPAGDPAPADLDPPPALDLLQRTFGLSGFERRVVLLCAGAELDARFAERVAAAAGGEGSRPTFGLALAVLPDGHWSALGPGGPLRYWRMLEVGSGASLVASPLTLDERILNYLLGIQHLDERLAGWIERPPPPEELVPSHRRLARRLAEAWSAGSGGPSPVAVLSGPDPSSKLAIASVAASSLGLGLRVLRAAAVPTGAAELEGLVRLWQREAILSACALYLDCDDCEPGDAARDSALARLVDTCGGALVVAGRDRRPGTRRPAVEVTVGHPTPGEQLDLWRDCLGERAAALDGSLEALAGQFRLSPSALRGASREALAGDGGRSAAELGERLWQACRGQTSPRLAELSQRLEPLAGWDDLVLPAKEKGLLREVVVQVRRRLQVYESWGFAARSNRGLGISALFAGVSGTGKTMAAEVLANELRLDLYRIDLSSVVSKYIGETEKNLRRVFDAAEDGGAILLFDEADALFGKRSEVKDSHDRYANIEISYLLQRMEAYRGLAILTSNMKRSLDAAFLRRIRFVVEFPFPGAGERVEIWRRIFPQETPVEGLDFRQLARLNLAGGNIRNIALGAAFHAAEEGRPVAMDHLLRAARSEYDKLQRPLGESEIRGWPQ